MAFVNLYFPGAATLDDEAQRVLLATGKGGINAALKAPEFGEEMEAKPANTPDINIIADFFRMQLIKSGVQSEEKLISLMVPENIASIIDFITNHKSIDPDLKRKPKKDRPAYMRQVLKEIDNNLYPELVRSHFPFDWNEDGPRVLSEWARRNESDAATTQKVLRESVNEHLRGNKAFVLAAAKQDSTSGPGWKPNTPMPDPRYADGTLEIMPDAALKVLTKHLSHRDIASMLKVSKTVRRNTKDVLSPAQRDDLTIVQDFSDALSDSVRHQPSKIVRVLIRYLEAKKRGIPFHSRVHHKFAAAYNLWVANALSALPWTEVRPVLQHAFELYLPPGTVITKSRGTKGSLRNKLTFFCFKNGSSHTLSLTLDLDAERAELRINDNYTSWNNYGSVFSALPGSAELLDAEQRETLTISGMLDSIQKYVPDEEVITLDGKRIVKEFRDHDLLFKCVDFDHLSRYILL